MGVEQLVEAGAVGVGEGVASAQQLEPGLEHLGVEGGLDAFGLSALHVRAHLGSPAANHLMTWKRSSTWRAWPRWASMADL